MLKVGNHFWNMNKNIGAYQCKWEEREKCFLFHKKDKKLKGFLANNNHIKCYAKIIYKTQTRREKELLGNICRPIQIQVVKE